MEEGEDYRLVKQEVILRIFAFAEERNNYKGQVGMFLNGNMHSRREMKDNDIGQKDLLFQRTTAIVDRMFPEGPGERFPTAVVEALFVGVMRNINAVEDLSERDLQERFCELREANPFVKDSLAEGLSKRTKVFERLQKADEIFSQ